MAAVAVLAACAFGGGHALAQVPTLGPDVTIPTLPIDDGGDGSTPVPTTTTTTTAPPSTTTTTAAPTTTTAAAVPTTGPSVGGPTEASRRSSPGPARRSSVRTTPALADPLDVAPAASDAPTIARLRQVTLPAARQFGFPLALAALVLAFLAVQGRLDARDPKLAAAPVSVDDDLLPFT